MYKLQDVRFLPLMGDEEVQPLYFTGDVIKEEQAALLPAQNELDCFTYFGSLSVEKWQRYTYAGKFFLVLNVKGTFELEFLGGYSKNGRKAQMKRFASQRYVAESWKEIEIALPADAECSVIGFQIYANSDLYIRWAYYAAEVKEESIRKPYVAITTTTFRKEAYVKRNMEQLRRELFFDGRYREGFCWNIIDNGRTLQQPEEDYIRVFGNTNSGGAGGFARGMIEAMRMEHAPTHILLMDDDVKVSTDSLKKIYDFLCILKPEYDEYFISGAMLKMGHPTVQHEDVGVLVEEGYHRPVKQKLNMAKKNAFIKNEGYSYEEQAHPYGAWWFCCIPMTFVREDNLPIPVFVRGDDMEYSFRNHAKFITMNGFCVWHEGFEGKFSTAMEFYQTQRNIWIVKALHEELDDVQVHRRFCKLFRQEIRKFDYRGVGFLLDALEDYLKGPEYLLTLNGEESIRKKREADYTAEPMPFLMKKDLPSKKEIRKRRKLNGWKEALFELTDNGQKLIPEKLIREHAGLFPVGYNDYPKKQFMMTEHHAVSVENYTVTVLRKDRKEYARLMKRFEALEKSYRLNNEAVVESYRMTFNKMTGIDFWRTYLGLEED